MLIAFTPSRNQERESLTHKVRGTILSKHDIDEFNVL
jgi:hypothetical protein